MIRYIKVVMIGKQNNQLYCTLTHINVYGKSMHVVLKETLKDDQPKNKTKPKNISNQTNSTGYLNSTSAQISVSVAASNNSSSLKNKT